MKNIILNKNIFLILFFLFVTLSFKPTEEDKIQNFDLKKIVEENTNCKFITNENNIEDQQIEVTPENNNTGVVIWQKGDEQDWSNGKYLVIEIYDENDFSGVINIEFYKETGNSSPEKIVLQSGEVALEEKDKPWFSSLMGILPKLKTKMVFH
jgi:hypothetical protein